MGKTHFERKTFHQCAIFSLFWSSFYAIRVVIYIVSFKNQSVDEAVEWQILQALISAMGICVSFSMFNAYRKDGSVFLIVSWVTWMFANFTLSLILLHMSLFELLSTSRTDFFRFLNGAIDAVHIFNAPGSIYFILVCLAQSLGRTEGSNSVMFNKKKSKDGYEQLKYEVLHLHEGLDEDEIVYYKKGNLNRNTSSKRTQYLVEDGRQMSRGSRKTSGAIPSDSDYNYKHCLKKENKEKLFKAAMMGDNDAIYALFMRRQSMTSQDEDGNTALHLAAECGNQRTCRMLIVLAAPERIWKVKNNEGKTAEQLAHGEDVKDDLHNLLHIQKKKGDVQSLVNDMLCDNKTVWDEHEHVGLCFDGGGARGFIHAQILLHLEHRLEGQLMDYVDWVGGTSCGGIFGLMTATGASLSFFRHALFRKTKNIFCGNKSKFPKHNSIGIETVMRKQFGDARMSTIRHKKFFVTVADSRKTPISMILFRNYRPRIPDAMMEKYQFLDPDRILIWKAARCTSAAPYYFDSFHGYTDGGIVANNPTLALLTDFMLVNKLEKYFGLTDGIRKEAAEKKMGVIISLGTGQSPVELTEGIDVNVTKVMAKKNPWKIAQNIMAAFKSAKNMMQVLIKECTSSNGQPVRYAREWCHSLEIPYFRFTPELSTDVPLDTTNIDILMDMLWETEVYVHGDASSDLDRLVRLLRLKKQPAKCSTANSKDE